MNTVEKKQGPRIFYGWWVVLASSIGLSTNPGQFAYGALGLFIVPFGLEFGWDRSEVSLALTLFTASLAVSLPAVGRLVDRYGARRVLLPSVVVFGGLLASIPLLVTRLWQLYLVFVLIGSIAAGANALPYLRIIGAWFNRRRGLAFGLAMTGGGLGYAYVPLLLQYLIADHGWRSGYSALALLVLLLALPLIAFVLKDSPGDLRLHADGDTRVPAAADDATTGLVPGAALRTARFWSLFVAFGCVALSLYGCLAHLVPMLADRGMSAMRAAMAASALGITITVSRALVGYLLDRLFAPRVAMVCFVCSALGLVLLATGAIDTRAFAAAALVGLSIGAEIDLLAYLVSRYFGLRHFGTIYGFMFAAFLLGTALGPLGYAVLYQSTGSYVLMLWIAVLLMVCAAAIMAFLPAYRSPTNR